MNYTALQADVAAYLHRSDLSSVIPGFIEKARVRIMRDLRALELEATSTLTGGSPFTLPTGCMEVRRVTSDGQPLRAVNPHELDYWTSLTSPQVYALYGRTLTAPGATDVTVWYFLSEATLSSGSTEHPTMAAYPQIWNAASLYEACLYTGDLEAANQWKLVYEDEIEMANRRATRLRHGTVAASINSDSYATFGEAGN